jgi:hypothetical protein
VAGEVRVEIRGLKEVRAALRRLGGNVPQATRSAAERAAQLVIDHAKPRVPVGPARAGHARDTMRVVDAGGRFFVTAGDAAHSYYPWLDFGGRVGRRKSVKRTYIKEGRYIFPAYSAVYPQIEGVMADALRDAARSAGLEVS